MARRATTVLLFGLFCVLVLPVFGPFQYAAATSDARAPTLAANDLYVTTDPVDVTSGETVRYWAPDVNAFRTGRVVNSSTQGYQITTGQRTTTVPAAAVTDRAVTIQGAIVRVPLIGPLLAPTRVLRPVLVAVFLTQLVRTIKQRQRAGDRHRDSIPRVRDVARPLFMLSVIAAIVLTPIGATEYRATTPTPVNNDGTPETGSVENITVHYPNRPFQHLVVSAEDGTVRSYRHTDDQLTVQVKGQSDQSFRTRISVYPYVAVLPLEVTERLHQLHPIIAILASTAILVVPLYIAYLLFIDRNRPLPRKLSRIW